MRHSNDKPIRVGKPYEMTFDQPFDIWVKDKQFPVQYKTLTAYVKFGGLPKRTQDYYRQLYRAKQKFVNFPTQAEIDTPFTRNPQTLDQNAKSYPNATLTDIGLVNGPQALQAIEEQHLDPGALIGPDRRVDKMLIHNNNTDDSIDQFRPNGSYQPYEVTSIVKQVFRKDSGHKEWALVSRKSPGKILRWFGTKKPSDARIKANEDRVQMFKHMHEAETTTASKISATEHFRLANKELEAKGLLPAVRDPKTGRIWKGFAPAHYTSWHGCGPAHLSSHQWLIENLPRGVKISYHDKRNLGYINSHGQWLSQGEAHDLFGIGYSEDLFRKFHRANRESDYSVADIKAQLLERGEEDLVASLETVLKLRIYGTC